MMNAPVTCEQIARWSEDYHACPMRQLATIAMSKTALKDVIYVPEKGNNMRQKFSIEIKTLPAANQQKSGRCWLFAATNVLRERIANKLNLDSFELSQAYMAFWDKFERANYFLETMMELHDKPMDDRTVAFVLQTGVHDGGQWDMFANIVRKYGIMPKDQFDDSFQACHSNDMNAVLNQSLKASAIKLRKMIVDGADDAALEAEKNAVLGKVYGFLCSCYGGEPPRTFDFEYVDKDGAYHIEEGYTPLTFADKYVGDLLDKTVSLINAPTCDKPYHKTFSIRLLNNIIGGNPVKHLNLPMDEFKAAVIAQLSAGKVVWFGSDCGKDGARDAGVWDDASFNAELMTGLDLGLTKAEALDSGFSAMNHAMVLTGVNLQDGKPTRWKIENSWGPEAGTKGYFVCSDSWFDKYVYQAAVEKEYLGDLADLAKQEPVMLEPWDPMGTLAD